MDLWMQVDFGSWTSEKLYYRKAGKLSGLGILHFDDFYGAGDEDFTKDILDKIFHILHFILFI